MTRESNGKLANANEGLRFRRASGLGTHRHVELLQDHLLELPQALVHLWEGVNNLTAPPSDPGAIARGVGRRFGQSGRNPTRLGSLFDRQRLNWACEDAGVGAGSDDSPEEHRDLRVGPAHGALHVRDGNHDHHRAPPPSRDSSEPDCCCKNSAPHSWASRLMRRKGTAPVPGGVASPAERTLPSPARLPAGARGRVLTFGKAHRRVAVCASRCYPAPISPRVAGHVGRSSR